MTHPHWDMTHSHARHANICCRQIDSFTHEITLRHDSSTLRHDSFTCATCQCLLQTDRLIRMCDMTRTHMSHDSSTLGHDSFTCATCQCLLQTDRLIHTLVTLVMYCVNASSRMCEWFMSRVYIRRDDFACVTYHIHQTWWLHMCDISHIRMCDISYSNVWCIRGTWIIHTCGVWCHAYTSDVYAGHESFTHAMSDVTRIHQTCHTFE